MKKNIITILLALVAVTGAGTDRKPSRHLQTDDARRQERRSELALPQVQGLHRQFRVSMCFMEQDETGFIWLFGDFALYLQAE